MEIGAGVTWDAEDNDVDAGAETDAETEGWDEA